MNKIIILLSTLVVLGALVLCQAVLADNAILSASPASATKNVGTVFNVSVNVDPQGNKVCVVKGTLNFSNLVCRSITIASGLMAQTAPTCSNPSFTLGIPKCTNAAQNILTVSVKANSVGQSGVSLTGSKVISVGTVVASSAKGGVYNIVTEQTPVPESTPAPQVQQPTPTPGPENNVAATASLASAGMKWYNYLLIILVVVIIIYGIYYLVTRRKKK